MQRQSSKIDKRVVMVFISIMLLGSSCEDNWQTRSNQSAGEGTPVEVAFRIGLADEADAYMLSPASATTKGIGAEALVASLVPGISTKGVADKPDKLYNLEILQYDASTGAKLNTASTIAEATIGSQQNVTLTVSDDCQLLIVARGADGKFPSITGKSNISQTRTNTDMQVKAATSTINNIGFGENANMNNMPYLLHLEHVKVTKEAGTGYGVIQGIDGQNIDVRLLLKRLAVRLDASWKISSAMQSQGYVLKEVRFSQVPANYRYLPDMEESPWGTTYPSVTTEFIDLYRLKDDELTATNGKKSIWLPVNVRGTSPAATSLYYRNKENAPIASSYLEFVVDNATKQERLYYRVYVGGPRTTDFNLYGNTDYSYVVNINSANHQTDARIRLLDQTPVKSTNLVPTSNCFMMKPGTNICFNPYKHEAGTNGWNIRLTDGTTALSDKTITSVKVLWQTKDAGTSGDLVMGYATDVASNHKNLVNSENIGNIATALVHVKVPVTKGGNAVIAAYNRSNVIVWSWHLWISDYVPVRINNYSEYQTAQTQTRNGTVHKYRSTLFNSGQKYANCVMMDRDLGAVAGGYPAIYKGENYTVRDNVETQGFLYQGARKDPLFISADGTTNEVDVIYNGDGISLGVTNINPNNVAADKRYEYSIQHPLHYIYGQGGIGSNLNKWDDNGKKTLDDPCPNGWRVPLFEGNTSISDFTGSILDGFQTGGTRNGDEHTISGNATFTYSSYYYVDQLYETAPNVSQSTLNAKGGRLFYLGANKQVEKTIHNTVWFPVSAERNYIAGALGAPAFAHMWFANNAVGTDMPGAGMKPHAMRVIRYGMGYGWPVRCIQYNK